MLSSALEYSEQSTKSLLRNRLNASRIRCGIQSMKVQSSEELSGSGEIVSFEGRYRLLFENSSGISLFPLKNDDMNLSGN
jgi:hypothetical protein